MTQLPISSPKVRETPEDQDIARLARALGHPVRVAILRYLKNCGGCLCGSLVDVFPLAQSTISQHLKKLKEAGWIQGDIDGPRTCYCINPTAMNQFEGLLGNL